MKSPRIYRGMEMKEEDIGLISLLLLKKWSFIEMKTENDSLTIFFRKKDREISFTIEGGDKE